MKKALVREGCVYFKLPSLRMLVCAALVCWSLPLALLASTTINYVQGSYATPQTPQSTVNVGFTAAQVTGDLNVVAVGWNDSSATVNSVTDTKGNTYTRAVGPTVQSGYASQSIYYAKNIAAAPPGANIVTVTFSRAAVSPDIRILEYSGADLNSPLDATAANTGSGSSSSSGSATTTNATDLIFGANLVQTRTRGPGGGFTKRQLTQPDGDIAEDKMVTTTGSYSATAPVSPSGLWIMQMVAFRTPSSLPTLVSIAVTPTNPSITVAGQQQFTGTGTYSDGSHQDLTDSATWTSSATTVATINSTGMATGVAAGTTTIKATSGTISGSTGLTVTAAGSFTMSASPASLSISQGNQGSSTITTVVSGGFNSAIALSSSGAPSGTTVSFSPATIPAPGGGNSSMTIVVGAGTATGTYPIVVTGNGGGVQKTTTVTLTVTGVSNFVITASPTSLTVAQGNHGTSALTTTISGGFNSSINLSSTGAPSGTTVSFSPNPIPAPGSGTSTMMVTVGSSTPTGTYSIVVTASGGGIQQNAVISLTVTATSATISYVQGNYGTPQGSQTTVSVPFTAAQVAGDLNVVSVGWNDSTSTVTSVTDTKGNTYTRAIGPTVQSGYATQSIYYAKNIAAAAAGSNSVTVAFSTGATSPDVRILEYSGADRNNPVDIAVAGSGNSTSSSSGSATTTNPTDLIFGANLVQTLTSGPGNGLTSRMITQPDGDIAEDQMASTTGSYSATAPLSSSGPWIMQMVAFRTPSGLPTLVSISVTPSNPSITAGGQQQFTATGNYSDGSHQNLTSSATWTSSATTVATIDSTGMATGVAAGATTIQAASGTIAGTTTLTVTTVGSFSLSASPASLTVGQGNQGTSTITTSVSGGFNSSITLSTSGAPSGATVSFSPSTISAPGNGSSTMTIIVGSGTAAGTYPITVTGNGGGVQQSTTVALTVTAVANFSISASPTSLTIVQGNQGTSTITTTISGGFNNSISLSAAGTPAGATASFSPGTLPAPGAGTSTLTITVGASTPVGTYAVTVAGNGGGNQHTVTVNLTVASRSTNLVLPLKASSNNRYLVDQDETPFLIMGDAPQSLVGNLSAGDITTYLADREGLGFNAIWVNLLCASYTYCNSNGTTYDGVAPFTSGSGPSSYDLATPNNAYFSRIDSMVNTASTYKLIVFLDPIETGSWLVTLRNNGSTKAFNYGVYIGNRYKNFTNIVWLHGNDFQTWQNDSDNNLVRQVMAGIASVDSNHLQTIELNYNSSYSNQDSALGSLLTFDSAYTYYETYDIVLQSYSSSPTIPTYLVEANYEYENNTGGLPGGAGTYVLREQAYWAILSGASGQLYGNHYTVTFNEGWQSFLDSPGALEIQYINQLFDSVSWWNLVPDTAHLVVTAGYGIYDGSNTNFTTATYCTTSWITSGSLALTYCPNASTLTVNLANFSGPVTAQWYDPSSGGYTAISGSPFPNSGTHQFTTPGSNHDGDPDWVLVLQT